MKRAMRKAIYKLRGICGGGGCGSISIPTGCGGGGC